MRLQSRVSIPGTSVPVYLNGESILSHLCTRRKLIYIQGEVRWRNRESNRKNSCPPPPLVCQLYTRLFINSTDRRYSALCPIHRVVNISQYYQPGTLNRGIETQWQFSSCVAAAFNFSSPCSSQHCRPLNERTMSRERDRQSLIPVSEARFRATCPRSSQPPLLHSVHCQVFPFFPLFFFLSSIIPLRSLAPALCGERR